MSRETRRTKRVGRCKASIENSASCHGLTAGRKIKAPRGRTLESVARHTKGAARRFIAHVVP
jgi:hypothetical protein